CRTLPFHEC
nr:Chain C, CYS-ARG-THR-LEU-PRO-PHE [Homo sapiens]7DNO_D Chain D, CYS-ARG-THR-LEU-PRO-PHE [Homo sapiens]